MFNSPELAEQLTWHSTHHSQDGKMRHPVDSVTWNVIEQKWPNFAVDPRNLRFGLATDGFNPFKNLSSQYSCWPVVLVIYNLPPSICMSQQNLLLTLLIPGPEQPGNNIDIYLQPLVDDLKELWTNGVEVYDAFRNSLFNLRDVLLWTINDYPAYGNVAGCTTKGEFACAVCGPNKCSQWSSLARKTVYLGHRRFLGPNHPWCSKARWFDGTKETRRAPKPLTGNDTLRALSGFTNEWGKSQKKRKRAQKGDPAKIWKKKSILFLTYHIGRLVIFIISYISCN